MTKLRELLNCILWRPSEREDRDKYVVIFRDGEIEQEIRLSEIVKVDGFGFTTAGDTYIPLHRIRTVRKGAEIVWRKPGTE